MKAMLAIGEVFTLLAGSAYAASQCPAGYNDEHGIDVKGDTAFGEASIQRPGGSTAQIKNGLSVPDPTCTAGAFNLTVMVDILTDPAYRTGCVRDRAGVDAC